MDWIASEEELDPLNKYIPDEKEKVLSAWRLLVKYFEFGHYNWSDPLYHWKALKKELIRMKVHLTFEDEKVFDQEIKEMMQLS